MLEVSDVKIFLVIITYIIPAGVILRLFLGGARRK